MPDDDQRHELVRGNLVSEPPTGYRHGRIAALLCCELEIYARRTKRKTAAVCEVGFCLAYNPDTVRAPDVAVISTDRLDTFDNQRGFFPGAPDLAIEVLSPSHRPGRVRGKIADYLDAGVSTVWTIDPGKRHVHAWHRSSQHDEGIVGEEITTLESPTLLPGFVLDSAVLF